MTKNLSNSPMPLDLDSLLQLQTSSSEEDDDIPLRTVDDILNESDSSSSSSPSSSLSSSSPSSPSSNIHNFQHRKLLSPTPPPKIENQIHNEEDPSRPNSEIPLPISKEALKSSSEVEEISQEPKISFSSRRKSGDSLFSLGRSNSRPLPPLFGSIKQNPKPGAALAAAAAASRSIPTPHAAAIKFRRANSGALQKLLLRSQGSVDSIGDLYSGVDEGLGHSDDVSDVIGSGISLLDGKLVDQDDRVENSSSDKLGIGGLRSEEISGGDEVGEILTESDRFQSIKEVHTEEVESVREEEIGVSSNDHLVDLNSLDTGATVEQQISGNDTACEVDESSEFSTPAVFEKDIASSPGNENVSVVDENLTLSGFEKHKFENDESSDLKDGEVRIGGVESNLGNDKNELFEETPSQLESKRSSKKSGKKLQSYMKPLELAEELEKKYASSSLHWEEGAAAQPMRLEGIRRGPPAVGYLQIDPHNAISRTISSQAFRRDHGSPQILAVHMNFIAVGMSKGIVLVVPSKYSAHYPDNMDAKMVMLGSQGEKSHSPATSMCFNQQGDLLLVGYSDGHLTVWDIQRATGVKTITGEHTSPVVHTLFLGQDTQVTRQFKVVTGDCKGLVLLHSFSLVPLLNRFNVKTQCLLDGQKTGIVLSASPLLIDGSFGGGLLSAEGNGAVSSSGLGSMVGGVVGGEAGWKLFSEGSSFVEEGVVIFVTNQTALVVRLSPNLEVYERLPKPDGVREGSMPYTAWKCAAHLRGSSTEALDKASLLAIAWDRKVQVAKLVKSELKVYREWTLDSAAIGVAWLDDQMLVVLTLRGQLSLFAKEGTELHRTSFVEHGSGGDDVITYHTYFTNTFGNPEKAYHNSVAVRGATIYILGPMHLVVSRLLPWKERIQVLQKAGDWMGALDMSMRLYDGHAHGVIDLPRTVDAIREAIQPYLVELLISYVDEVFSYISVAFCSQVGKADETKNKNTSVHSEIEEQYARVGGVAVEFCVHIKRTDILFDDIFSKFVAVQQGGSFLELLEPYILKDMLGSLPPEIMQALVEHYSSKGWLQRVEQCVLHMDISSLDFNQVVILCREHGLYGALIYLFNKGLDDFKAPLEELLVVVQNNQRTDAAAIGYRMLVYLKYCFLGLAFPPGHGTLPTSRLPLLRTELLQFLLEDSTALNSQVVINSKSSTRACPNICYLLWLDTEATLEVLRCAFLEEETPKSDHSLHVIVDASSYENKENDSKNFENQNLMVQNIIDTLVHILDMEISEVVKDGTGSPAVWPSKKDIGHLLEFIACFVACKSATISRSVLNHILECLISDSDLSPSQKIETAQREKQVLALLKVVPETDWDTSDMLNLCEKAQFYQVCGLIHRSKGQYLAALDSYMKDVDEPIHAFAFINSFLLQLRDAEYSTFQSAIISRIPELVKLSREGAVFLVIDHFSKESHHILSELRSHPKSLFLYLKTIIEVYLSGTLDFSSLERGYVLDVSWGRRMKDQSNELEPYLERIADFPKLLHHNSIHVTDEMAELYLELLCQYEPTSALKFLETFENYRVEHCLRLCQEYGVTDAAAFLLERVGDVGSALLLIISGLNEKLCLLDTALENIVSQVTSGSFTEIEQLNNSILKIEEVNSIRDILHSSIGLCQRNTTRLDPQESESLWFRLLDSFCQPLRDSYNGKDVSEGRNHAGSLAATFGIQEENDVYTYKWRITKFNNGAHILQRVFSQFIREIVEGMIGYVPLPTIMAKLLSDNGSQEFGDFKLTILGILGTYGYERRILDTAKSLIEDDTFYTMTLLKKRVSHAYAPQNLICCICGSFVTAKESSDSSIRVFNCGHTTHMQCEFHENEALNSDSSAICPVCMPKKKTSRARSKSVLMENGLVKNSLSRPQQAQGIPPVQHLHESDPVEKPYGLHQMSRFEMLSSLGKAQRTLQIDTLPQLRLTPPAIYHEKVKKGTDLIKGESSSIPVKSEKSTKLRQVKEIKAKGSSIRFPLKSSIFSTDNRRKK
ncbi:transducin family protein / WD-40 repeat family protein [Tasmannia lanceolata]|uniref:transducin family protein / WD-40 repeat family protein n=1 Tax=Tasmannia lanceolata TaxID=3420 RepID=UPI004063C9FC